MTPLILKTCAGFVDEGFEVELWVPSRHNPEWKGKDPFTVHGVERNFTIRTIPIFDAIPIFGAFGFLIMVFSFNFSTLLALLGGDRKTTCLYAHDLRDLIFPCLLGYPVYSEIHDFYESSRGWVNRMVLRRTKGLIVTNTLKMKHIHERYGFPLERMIHQPNAVDYDFFHIEQDTEGARRDVGLPTDKKIVLYTGHLFSWKGVDTLALAAMHLPEDVLVCFVGGTEEDREALQTFIKERSIPRIMFFPHQPHARIPHFMQAADVLVLPNTAREAASKYETSPVKLFEYMSSDVPIVASDLPSIRDIVDENEVAFFEPDDPESLAKVITDVLAHPEAARTRSQNASAHGKRLSWPSRASAITALIRS
jgi:glycosyltransferase involved in cell wall biosynthesis